MRYLRLTFLLLLAAAALPVNAGVDSDRLPAGTQWYLHVDLEGMRNAEAGTGLYAWLQTEVFAEVREEVGIDLDKETDQITAFAAADNDLVVIIDGELSQLTRDRLLGLAATSGKLNQRSSEGKSFYYVAAQQDDEGEIDTDFFGGGGFFSFDVNGKLILTSSQKRIETLLASKGRLPRGTQPADDALMVLSANRQLLQAGLRTDELTEDLDWNSNILRSATQVAMVLAEADQGFDFEARLVTTEPEMADSLASIVRGLISLQAFSNDLDPEVSSLLQSTRVATKDNALSIRLSIDGDLLADALD